MQKELTPKQKFLNSLATFFQKYRVILLILLAALIVGFFVLGILDEVRDQKIEKSTQALYEAETSYREWSAMEEGDAKTLLQDSVFATLAEISENYKNTYAADRAVYLQAEAYLDLEQYEAAIVEYRKIISESAKSIVVPAAINNCALAYEKTEQYEMALETYLILVNDYAFESAITPHAILKAGYIYVKLGQDAEALTMFNKLVEDYPNSSWTNFARTSIIHLNSSN